MKRLGPLVVVAAIACLVLWGWMRARSGATAALADPPQSQTVSVVRAGRHDLAQPLTVTGELVPFEEVEVMAKVAGYVEHIYVDVGDTVRRGQVLAVLEVPEMKDDLTRAAAAIQRNRAELERAQDELKRAESAYQMAHLTFDRLRAVAKTQPGLIAQQEIDDASTRDMMAAAQVAGTRSALAAGEEQIRVAQAEQSKLTTLMNYSRVVAPFDGVVTKRYANTGSMIQAGTASQSQAMPVVRLSQNQLLRLVLPVPESAAGSVKPGSLVEVHVPSLDRVFSGRVARVADKVDTSTRTMQTQVDVPNPDRTLIPGMYAEVTLTLAEKRQALAVPLEALDRSDKKTTVHVVRADGSVDTRPVSVGLETARLVEIRSELRDGELVVVGDHGRLIPNQKVTPKLAGGTE